MVTKTMPLDDAFALLVLTSCKYLAAKWSETSPTYILQMQHSKQLTMNVYINQSKTRKIPTESG